MGAFAYAIPSVLYKYCIIMCVNLVLTMVWVDSPKFFCAFSKTLRYFANNILDTELPAPSYGYIAKIPSNGPDPLPQTCKTLAHIGCFMDNVISAVKFGP